MFAWIGPGRKAQMCKARESEDPDTADSAGFKDQLICNRKLSCSLH